MKCQICRRYVRLPNRPQTKVNNAGTFNHCVQADLFKLWGTWIFVLVDEATRYKVAVTTESRESQELQQKLLEHWMRYFGPPASLVMDQETEHREEAKRDNGRSCRLTTYRDRSRGEACRPFEIDYAETEGGT
jgi:transposase InsO family protein